MVASHPSERQHRVDGGGATVLRHASLSRQKEVADMEQINVAMIPAVLAGIVKQLALLPRHPPLQVRPDFPLSPPGDRGLD